MPELNSKSLTSRDLQQAETYLTTSDVLKSIMVFSCTVDELRKTFAYAERVRDVIRKYGETAEMAITSLKSLFPFSYRKTQVIKEVAPTVHETYTLARDLINIDDPIQDRLHLGLKCIAGGSFTYRRRVLRKISLGSKHGRFLRLLLMNPTHFLKDEDIYKKLNVEDGRSFSWIRRNLISAFKQNGLKVELERRKYPHGYVLISVGYLH